MNVLLIQDIKDIQILEKKKIIINKLIPLNVEVARQLEKNNLSYEIINFKYKNLHKRNFFFSKNILSL